ncbi:MAG: chromosome segregation protein SMC [Cyclobacteriaceae bacterium]
MEEEVVQSQPEEAPKKKILVVILAILLVVVGGGLIYKFIENQRLTEEQAQTDKELEEAYYSLDSIGGELDKKILEISQLGGEIDTLIQIREQLEEEKRQFRTRAYRQIAGLKDKVDGYQELLLNQDEEIKKLKLLNQELNEENTELKTEKNELAESIRDLKTDKTELEEKIQVAGRLKIEGMKIIAVSSRGKEREGEFRNRHVDNLKIQFNISENKVAPIEGKDIMVKVTAPDGNVLFDVASGSGSFIFEGREMFYTAKQEILYDRNEQNLTFLYKKGSDYAIGKHKIDVYTDDYKMGSGAFVIK